MCCRRSATRIYSEADASIAGRRIRSSSAISFCPATSRRIGWPGRLDGGVIDGSFIRTDIATAIGQPFGAEIVSQLALEGCILRPMSRRPSSTSAAPRVPVLDLVRGFRNSAGRGFSSARSDVLGSRTRSASADALYQGVSDLAVCDVRQQ
jgi:hypothetical protein